MKIKNLGLLFMSMILLMSCGKDDNEPADVSVTSITLNETGISLLEGENYQLTATVAPENASDKNVTWTSSNKAVATVDAKGKVTAVKTGKATITATAKEGSKTADCTVTVTYKFSISPPKITLTTAKAVGEKIKLKLNAKSADQAGVWIDLNNNGKKDSGEAVTTFGDYVEYTLDKQTFTIYGKAIELYCFNNQLTALDVSKNTQLKWLYCRNNQLTALDVSKNTKLQWLDCRNNKLSKLNVANGNNKNFKYPGHSDSPAFDARNCPNLNYIKVDKNFNPDKQTGKGEKWKKDDGASWQNGSIDYT